MLGMAQKAGRVVSGGFAVEKLIQSVAAYALALASFRLLPSAVMPSTLPPFVTIFPSLSLTVRVAYFSASSGL